MMMHRLTPSWHSKSPISAYIRRVPGSTRTLLARSLALVGLCLFDL
jgi:hypothetical protein